MSGECTEGGKSSDCGRAATNCAERSAIEDSRSSVCDNRNVSQGAHLDVSGETSSCCQLSAAGAGEQTSDDEDCDLQTTELLINCVLLCTLCIPAVRHSTNRTVLRQLHAPAVDLVSDPPTQPLHQAEVQNQVRRARFLLCRTRCLE